MTKGTNTTTSSNLKTKSGAKLRPGAERALRLLADGCDLVWPSKINEGDGDYTKPKIRIVRGFDEVGRCSAQDLRQLEYHKLVEKKTYAVTAEGRKLIAAPMA